MTILYTIPKKNSFNYFHSSSRIVVDCCSGEISLRFGILWKVLQYSLAANIRVIDTCLRLHTFIVNYRLGLGIIDNDEDIPMTREREIFEEDVDAYRRRNQNSEYDGNLHQDGALDRKNLADRERNGMADGKRIRQNISDDIKARSL